MIFYQLKYDVIYFCFLFWRCKFSNFLVTVDTILWLSSSKKEHSLILSSIFNDSVKLSVSSSVSSTSSSSSSSSSEIFCAMFFSSKTALMQSSCDFCRQSILCSLIRGSDAGISASKFTYSVAESSGQHSWKSASNYKSSPSISIKSSFLIIPHFSKQSFIIIPVTSFHASWAHRMAISMFTSLIICVAEEYSLILASAYSMNLFLYFTLKFWIIPASSGWSLEVEFLGRKNNLYLRKWIYYWFRMTRSII